MAAERSPVAGSASLNLPREQQLAKPPPTPPTPLLETPRPAEPPASPAEVQPEEKAHVPAAEEEQLPAVKELDRRVAELSVCLVVVVTAGGWKCD